MKFPFGILIIASLLSACNHTQETTSAYSLKSGGEMPSSQQGLNVKHADLGFTIKPDQQIIDGVTTLTLMTTTPRKSFSVDLDRVFHISEVLVNGQVLAPELYSNPDGMLLVKQAVSGEFTVTIKYNGQPRVPVRAPWDGGLMWEKTPNGADWIATAVQGEGCDLFWPCIDHPSGEPTKVDLHINVPKPLVAASNGVLLNVTDEGATRTYHWQTKSLHNTYGIALNIAPYELLETKFTSVYGNTLDIQFFHLPERTEKAKILFAEIPEMINFFERMIGPYPFGQEKVGIAETPHLGMEHQTINAYGNEYKKDQFGYDWLMQHEFAHEWFGNQLTNDDWDHMWLHEGFGSYMQPLFAQYLHGDLAYKANLAKQRTGIVSKSPLVSNQVREVEQVYQHDTGPGGDIYTKGSWVLHTLRYLIGDDAFFKATKQLVYGTTDPQPGNFTPVFKNSADFVNIVNTITGKDMSWFFDVYLYQADLPKLVVDRKDDAITVLWEIENNKPFHMPVELSINGKITTLDLTKPVKLAINKMDVVILDPNSKILKYDQHIVDFQNFRKEQSAKK
ncbi:M1 family metallopeptidase [Psychrosphaera sp. F3M07]|uniref:M1 family metallopeptidase n=1 Tax=Psychrosphaera sp. F3M07 TaxID=2841560 RepID=UPI001C083533|nr:M1 family metallopeptidase [Psychrosphaera sp. F3M07]MBU2918053.1 M1 family metallopeptidase [Psychrosphaera sp. F3M07]